ncbi:hypothetical protein D3C81_1890230 [compost metagenome]
MKQVPNSLRPIHHCVWGLGSYDMVDVQQVIVVGVTDQKHPHILCLGHMMFDLLEISANPERGQPLDVKRGLVAERRSEQQALPLPAQ